MMEKILNNKLSPAVLGFYQAILVVIYTIKVAVFMNALQGGGPDAPEIIAAVLFLSLFVLSAGISATLVFGLPAYYAFVKNNISRAVSTLAFTFLYIFISVLIAAMAILTIF